MDYDPTEENQHSKQHPIARYTIKDCREIPRQDQRQQTAACLVQPEDERLSERDSRCLRCQENFDLPLLET